MIQILLVFIIMLISIVIYLIFTLKKQTETKDIKTEEMKLAMYEALKETGIEDKIEAVKNYANDIRTDYRNLDKLLSIPQNRGYFGEIVLEKVLSDNLPPDMFAIRKEMPWGKTPDAVIYSANGIICIDSKFPLENYKMYINETDDKLKREYENKFIRDIKKHMEKIARDYVREDFKTLPFAFAYLPSESVYYFLIKEKYEILREFALKGVIVTSPLTLLHNIILIKSDIGLRKLEDDVKEIQEAIIAVSRKFEEVGKEYKTLLNHIEKSYKKANSFDNLVKEVLMEFDKIKKKDI